MGFLDNVKNSITGSDDSGGKFNQEKYDNSFTSSDPSDSPGKNGSSDLKPESGMPEMGNSQNPQQNNPGPQSNMNQQNQNSGPQLDPPADQPGSSPGREQPKGGGQRNNRGSRSSNPQAGRPEPGSSQPQVSDQTRGEMEDAGFEFDQQNNRSRNNQVQHQDRGTSRDQRSTPISDQQSDMEKIKAQNEQIIELLKRISQSVQHQGDSVTGSSSRRHGGRR